ncbi:MAG: Arm DNA-binding domain-containing protein [Alphaproteobacteria bacterium]
MTDKEIPGLHLRYSCRTGLKVFYLSYLIRHTTKQRNIRVGRYGDFSIKDIRYRAIKFRQMVSDGRDPMQELIDEQKQREEDLAKRRNRSRKTGASNPRNR